MDTIENQAQVNPQYCGPRTLSYIENISTANVGYVTVTETTNAFFEFTVTTLPAGTAPGSIFFTVSVSLTNYPGVTYSLPVELQVTCPATYSSIMKTSTPSFATPFAYDLATLPSHIETVSTIQILPDLCGFSVALAQVIDITDAANPLV